MTSKDKTERIGAEIDKKIAKKFREIITKKSDYHPYGSIKSELEKAIRLYIKADEKKVDINDAIESLKLNPSQWEKTLEEMGIIDVLRPRRESNEAREALLELYSKEFEKSSEIRMLGICFIDFFRGNLYNSLITTSLENGKKIRIIIMKPDCDAARFRISIEQGKDTPLISSTLFMDISNVTTELWHLQQKYPNQIFVHYADEMPPCYCIICEDAIFVEMYHSGNTGKISGPVEGKESQDCIGGLGVPYFIFSTKSTYGKILIDSFERLFEYWQHYSLKAIYEIIIKLQQQAIDDT